LPELVQVKTGEEEEEELFGHKAKMYRWVLIYFFFNKFIEIKSVLICTFLIKIATNK
jgi:hypothetical protein